MIKKLLFILLTGSLLWGGTTAAQVKKDERTIETRIADLLAQMPATKTAQLESNMKEMATLGETGLIKLIMGLTAPGKGNNAAIEYAVSGFTGYATKPEQQDLRTLAINAYCKALAATKAIENKAFLISQFDVLGNNTAVNCLATYLQNEQLVDETARAMAQIGTPAAVAELTKALDNPSLKIKMSAAEALGHTDASAAVPALIKLAIGTEQNLVKVSLYALAKIGDAMAEEVLLSAAAQAGYKYDATNAVAALLVYAENKQKTNKAVAEKIALIIAERATGAEQVHQRIAALKILSAAGTNQQVLLAAMKDKQERYRAAAARFATPGINNNTTAPWVAALKKADAPTQVAILDMLAAADAKIALPEIVKLVKSDNADVQNAAIYAAIQLGEATILPDLLRAMNAGSAANRINIANGILTMKGAGVAPTVAAYIPTAKPEVQAALIKILAARAANEQIEFIYDALRSNNAEVRNAAYKALQSVAVAANAPQLFVLLNAATNPTEQVAVQEAIVAAYAGTNIQPDAVMVEMDAAPAEKKWLYYKILASLGGDKALNHITAAYAGGDEATKKAAIAALSTWKDTGALGGLLQLARTNTNPDLLNQTLNGYLQLVRKSAFTPEQRLLLLRNAMDLTDDVMVRQQILKDATQAKTYHTLLFAGKYLDNTALQQSAANTVMNVAMAGKYNGDLVKGLLNKTIAVITGPDAGYQQEGLRKYIAEMEAGTGFIQVFNGKDLTGWKGLVGDPLKRAKMTPEALATAQAKADAEAKESWKVNNKGELEFQIKGDNLATVKKYGDMEMLIDWKIIDDKKGEGDAGIYLRGTPQVQIWDLARTNVGAQVGSGGLYNNQKNPSKPLKVADNKLDEWNTFRILMIGDRVTVYLNGQLVTDNVILENYWNRNLPIFAEEQIELQAHGSPVAYRDIYIREIARPKPFELSADEQKEGFKVLFDGTNMHHWTGNTTDYIIENGHMAIRPKPGKGSGGNLFTKEQYSDFIFRFEFQLTPGGNNGLGIRAPLEGDAAYTGMELQILDNDAPIYRNLKPYQYHGSIYGTIPAKRGFLKPVGEWNYQEVIAKGSKIKVILNGTVILDGDIEPFKNGTPDGEDHPGLKRTTGHIGFLGHGSPLQFRNIRVKDLSPPATKK